MNSVHRRSRSLAPGVSSNPGAYPRQHSALDARHFAREPYFVFCNNRMGINDSLRQRVSRCGRPGHQGGDRLSHAGLPSQSGEPRADGMQARFGALQEQLASARSAPAKQTIVALQTSSPATWMGYVEKNRRLVRAAARVLL